jgi:hypothetical protein
VVQLVALVLAFVVSGAPAWISELTEDDCAEECAKRGCSDEGCGACSIVCSSCPRAHALVPSLVPTVVRAATDFARISSESSERLPDDPVLEGVFHPPRLVAG